MRPGARRRWPRRCPFCYRSATPAFAALPAPGGEGSGGSMMTRALGRAILVVGLLAVQAWPALAKAITIAATQRDLVAPAWRAEKRKEQALSKLPANPLYDDPPPRPPQAAPQPPTPAPMLPLDPTTIVYGARPRGTCVACMTDDHSRLTVPWPLAHGRPAGCHRATLATLTPRRWPPPWGRLWRSSSTRPGRGRGGAGASHVGS